MPVPHIVEKQLASELSQLPVATLSDDAAVRSELQRIAAAADYFVEICHASLDEALQHSGHSPEECTLVDYRGGFGLLSVMAKRLEFKQVIYISDDEETLQTARRLSELLQGGADTYLLGDLDTLRPWCVEQRVVPNILVAMNEIGHLYVLDHFFASAHALAPHLTMVLTTEATPYNKRTMRHLRHAMQADEMGHRNTKGFWQLRRDYVQKLHPDMPERQLDYWASQTRGLNYEDIERAVESQSPNLLQDPYNTCHPATGRWSQRILPIDDYRQLLDPYGYGLLLLPAFCNEHRRGPARWNSRHNNAIIRMAPRHEPTRWSERRRMRKALRVAPFIFLIATPK